MKWLLLLLLIPAFAWAHPHLHPRSYKMVYSPIGAWQAGDHGYGRFINEITADILECSFTGAGFDHCLFEYDTSGIPAGAIIDGASLTYSVFNSDPFIVDQSLTLQCYVGWSAPIPPDTSDATFLDGTLVGSDTIPPNVFPYSSGMTLSTDAIIKAGITTLRFQQLEKTDEQYLVILADGWPQLTVTYHTPARRKWHFMAAAE